MIRVGRRYLHHSGTERIVSLADVVRNEFTGANLPEGMEPGMLAHAAYHGKEPSYPNGCHVCEVEIDPETGMVEVLNYVVVDDFGTILNPLLVHGQVHGGVAQGVGQILLENTVYDADGQLLTASFMDYGMPRADNFAISEFGELCPPRPIRSALKVPVRPLCWGHAVMMNVVMNALSPLGIRDLDMPASPASLGGNTRCRESMRWQRLRIRSATEISSGVASGSHR